MGAVLVRAHVVQSHLFLSSSGLGLEKYGFSVATLWARMVFGSKISLYLMHCSILVNRILAYLGKVGSEMTSGTM